MKLVEKSILFNSSEYYQNTRDLSPIERSCFFDLLLFRSCYGSILDSNIDFITSFCGVPRSIIESTLSLKFELILDKWVLINEQIPIFKVRHNELSEHHLYSDGDYQTSLELRQSPAYRKFKKAVLKRDVVCVNCNSSNKLHVHHIKSFSLHPKLRTDPSNGIVLCQKCHIEHHKNNTLN